MRNRSAESNRAESNLRNRIVWGIEVIVRNRIGGKRTKPHDVEAARVITTAVPWSQSHMDHLLETLHQDFTSLSEGTKECSSQLHALATKQSDVERDIKRRPPPSAVGRGPERASKGERDRKSVTGRVPGGYKAGIRRLQRSFLMRDLP